VRYYDFPGAGLTPTVFDRGVAGGGAGFGGGAGLGGSARVPRPYGGWSLEAMDAHGGWLASVVDMVRFVGAVDGRPGHPQVLGAPAIREMIARPAPPLAAAADTWYGMGWQVRPLGRDANWWHSGSLDGTTTLMVRAANGVTWAAFFNSRPRLAEDFGNELDQAMWQAFDAVRQWPG
jgi:Beta-lactamase